MHIIGCLIFNRRSIECNHKLQIDYMFVVGTIYAYNTSCSFETADNGSLIIVKHTYLSVFLQSKREERLHQNVRGKEEKKRQQDARTAYTDCQLSPPTPQVQLSPSQNEKHASHMHKSKFQTRKYLDFTCCSTGSFATPPELDSIDHSATKDPKTRCKEDLRARGAHFFVMRSPADSRRG